MDLLIKLTETKFGKLNVHLCSQELWDNSSNQDASAVLQMRMMKTVCQTCLRALLIASSNHYSKTIRVFVSLVASENSAKRLTWMWTTSESKPTQHIPESWDSSRKDQQTCSAIELMCALLLTQSRVRVLRRAMPHLLRIPCQWGLQHPMTISLLDLLRPFLSIVLRLK